MIAPEDMALVQLIGEPANAVEAVFAFYEAQELPAPDSARQAGTCL
jgi:hypothetical protein